MTAQIHRASARARALAVALALCTFAGMGTPRDAGANAFSVECASSHLLHDDPIVFPGRPGASHRHEFFGATTAAAHSTTRSLMRSRTTCRHARDTASYWVPSLELDGVLHRGTLTAYYQRAGKQRAAAPPVGLRMIAGDMHAHHSQPFGVTSWQCSALPGVRSARSGRHSRTVPSCRTDQALAGWVRFPDCWNGRNLDSADHRSHLTRSRAGECPPSHPVELMRIVLRVTWQVRPRSPELVTLGGGKLGPNGMHGDFWNSWNQRTLQQLRWDCIELARACGSVRAR